MDKKILMDKNMPAFPSKITVKEAALQAGKAPYEIEYLGMMLRDWMAGQALMGLLANYWVESGAKVSIEDYTHDAYQFADAMLLEKEK